VVLNSGGKKFREVIVRFSEVIVQQKCNKNSGHLRLCQQPRAAHALCSDQLPKTSWAEQSHTGDSL
jgi:hypothetical protein